MNHVQYLDKENYDRQHGIDETSRPKKELAEKDRQLEEARALLDEAATMLRTSKEEFIDRWLLARKIDNHLTANQKGERCVACGGMGCDTTVSPGDPPGDCPVCHGTGKKPEAEKTP